MNVFTIVADIYLFTYREFETSEVLSSHSNYVSSVCVFNDGNWIATGGNDKKIYVYNVDCSQPFACIEEHEVRINHLCCQLAICLIINSPF